MIQGTKEWAQDNFAIDIGCENRCRYCYGRAMAAQYGRQWPETPTPRSNPTLPKKGTSVFCFSTHDIVPVNLNRCTEAIKMLLGRGHRVLIVTKPHLDCVRSICGALRTWRSQVLWRFTIGSADDAILKWWEPGAPCFGERVGSLKASYDAGYQTSISIEPMLDSKPDDVICAVDPYVTETIWLGRANKLVQRMSANGWKDAYSVNSARALDAMWNDEAVRALYSRLKHLQKIRFKDSIRKVVGIPFVQEAGK